LTTQAQSLANTRVGGHGADGNWLELPPGARFAVRTSSDDTSGHYAVLEVVAAPGCGPSLHIHQNEDEHFIVLEGNVRFICGEGIFDAPAGSTCTVPKGVRHAWANLSESDVRMLVTCAPGGFERWRELGGATATVVEAIATSYGCSVVGAPVRG
jgi:mannose-6-phosphate isomerase-like protein (cupin superfamily)